MMAILTDADDTTLMAGSEEELKNLLMRVKRGEWKSWFNNEHSKSTDHGIRSHQFSSVQFSCSIVSDSLRPHGLQHASSIPSWQIDGEIIETVTDLIFLGSKITADGDCSHEIKRLAPWKKSCDQPRQHIKKQRHYFTNKGPPSQSCGFSSSHV